MQRRILSFFIIFLSIIIFLATAASAVPPPPKPSEKKVIQAVPVSGTVRIDGVLSEPVWQREGSSDFVQSDPVDGGEPSEITEVWVAYDKEALYVAARLYDSSPDKITSRLGRRDDMVESDWFIFAVDPYLDHRSGFQFAVNPSGSIVDWTLYNDINSDSTWDGVWEWAARINDKGWTVEMMIPFNQLRFPKKQEYVWGVNFIRRIQRKHERNTFVWVPKDDVGYVSRFARLEGIRGIDPGRHFELWPYTVGEARFSPEQPENPFSRGQSYKGNIGFDMKLGVMSNLTLDATVNPDFGQVEVDPAVINLSAFETYYQEKRPFFIEGSNIFDEFGRGGVAYNININWPRPTFFYSRRIGRAPQGYVTQSGWTDYPDRTTILGAFKLSGKLANSWNLSFINALTSREYAEVDVSGSRYKEEVEPFSYYGVLRTLKEFNNGQHGLGILVTSVIRDLRNDTLARLLSNKAFSLAVDGWSYLDKDRNWIIGGWLGGTYLTGSKESMLRRQLSSLHYFQRPDATHVEVNEESTSLFGWGGQFHLNKQRGRTLLNISLGVLSPGFDPNDAGFQFGSSDLININFIAGYLWPHPTKVTRSAILAVGPFRSYDFGGNKTGDGILVLFQGQLLNYWNFDALLAYNPETYSKNLTRGGPLVKIPYGYQVRGGISTDSRKPVIFSANSNFYRRPIIDSVFWSTGFGVRWKPRSNISLAVYPDYSIQQTDYQWIRKVDDPLMTQTFGARYVFGRLFQRVLSAEIRINWTFTPRLSLQAYLQPFLAVGNYDHFKELARPKSIDYTVYGETRGTVEFSEGVYTIDPDGPGPASSFSFYNPDFNFKSLRGTIVLRWEYHPGSILYLVWTQNRHDFSHPGEFRLGRDLGDLFTAPGDNIFLVKATYRWNM